MCPRHPYIESIDSLMTSPLHHSLPTHMYTFCIVCSCGLQSKESNEALYGPTTSVSRVCVRERSGEVREGGGEEGEGEGLQWSSTTDLHG